MTTMRLVGGHYAVPERKKASDRIVGRKKKRKRTEKGRGRARRALSALTVFLVVPFSAKVSACYIGSTITLHPGDLTQRTAQFATVSMVWHLSCFHSLPVTLTVSC